MITFAVLLVQIFWLFAGFKWLGEYSEISLLLMLALSAVVLVYIINKDETPEFKLTWVIPICTAPVFGVLLYLFVVGNWGNIGMKKGLDRRLKETEAFMHTDEETKREIEKTDLHMAGLSRYTEEIGGFPSYKNSSVVYFPSGEAKYEDMLKELEKAEEFIFLEYFILGEGTMWGKVLEILEKKAKQGVEVRVIYDDFGSVLQLPKYYEQFVEQKGIQCVAFNKLIPLMAIILNNRDHRKIVVIDGKIGYTGGINLADEYINYKTLHGYWKDAGIRLEGEAVWNFTVMFLQMWNISRDTDEDFSRYRHHFTDKLPGKGYVQPYGDTPFDNETVGENIYLNMIGYAKKYFYVFTPYLITDNEMCTALKLAAKRGVDVRIVTPGIPDKKMAYWLTQSSYQNLIEAGVKIYQYSPGFIHSKCVLCDDEIAAVGTINFDYRSFYHHFECGVFLYRADAVGELKKDMENTFVESEEITLEWCQKKFMKLKKR